MIALPFVLNSVAGDWSQNDFRERVLIAYLGLGVPAFAATLKGRSFRDSLIRIGASAAVSTLFFMILIAADGRPYRDTVTYFILGTVAMLSMTAVSSLFFPRE